VFDTDLFWWWWWWWWWCCVGSAGLPVGRARSSLRGLMDVGEAGEADAAAAAAQLSAGTADGSASGSGSGSVEFLPWSVCYDSTRMGQVSFASRVRVVSDAVTALDTEQRTLSVGADGAVVPYDLLLLAPGLQDQLAHVVTRTLHAPVGTYATHRTARLTQRERKRATLTCLCCRRCV
jgi:hypothetical protein